MRNFNRRNKQWVFLIFVVSAIVLTLAACGRSSVPATETSQSTAGLQQTQSNLEMNRVKVSPAVVVPQQTVAVTGTVINNDSIDRIYSTELMINGISRGMQEYFIC